MNLTNVFDVVISGAGPAGSTCALFLAKSGKKVLLLEKEKFPRDKVCADNKTWKCLDILKELNLWKEFEKLPKKEITGVLIASPDGSEIYTPLWKEDVKQKGPWYNVRREIFDNFLAEACKKSKNITLREKCEVVKPIVESGQVTGVEFRNEKGKIEKAFAKVVIAADGSASPIATTLNLSPQVKGRYAVNARTYFSNVAASDKCELYYLKGVCPGYFWIFPVDGNLCNVGIGMRLEDIQRQNIKLEEKIKEIIDKKFKTRFANAKQVTPVKQWGLSVLGGKRSWSGDGFILVGDAGTFAMTFSGEGVGPAMRSGKTAAKVIEKAFEQNNFSANTLKEYDEKIWTVLESEVKGFRWLEFLTLNEWVFNWVAKKAAKNKELIELSSKMQNDYTLSQQLTSPKTLLKLIFS